MALTTVTIPVLTFFDGKLVPITDVVIQPDHPRLGITEEDEIEILADPVPQLDAELSEENIYATDGEDNDVINQIEDIHIPVEVPHRAVEQLDDDEVEQLQCDNEGQFWDIITRSGFDPLTGKVRQKLNFNRVSFAMIYGKVANRLRHIIEELIPSDDLERVLSHYVWQGPDYFRTACDDPTFIIIDHTDGMCFGHKW